MSDLDDELASAIKGDEPPASPEHQTAAPTVQKPKRHLGLLVALVIMGLAIGTLVMSSFRDAAVYSKTVDQLLASRDRMTGRAVRVEGMLVHGSLIRRDQPCEYRFRLAKNNAVIEVRYPQCVVPDTFRDRPDAEVGVTVEGQLQRDGSFEATQIMAKCPSKYEEREGNRVPVTEK